MHPVLFHFAGHAVETSGLLYLVAIVVAGGFAVRVARAQGWDPHDVIPGLLIVVPAAYLGARLHGALLQARRPDSLQDWLLPHGLSFLGGLATGSLAILAYFKLRRIPLGRAADALTPIGPVLYALFRLGCLANGDDYGKATALPWGIRFPEGSPPTLTAVHPTQLYEMLLMIPAFAWLWRRRNAARPPGTLTFELCILMGAERFLVEFWRTAPPVAFGLTMAQWLTLILLLLGVVGRTLLSLRQPQ